VSGRFKLRLVLASAGFLGSIELTGRRLRLEGGAVVFRNEMRDFKRGTLNYWSLRRRCQSRSKMLTTDASVWSDGRTQNLTFSTGLAWARMVMNHHTKSEGRIREWEIKRWRIEFGKKRICLDSRCRYAEGRTRLERHFGAQVCAS